MNWVLVFTDYTDVVDVVGSFATWEAARDWAINNRPDESWWAKPVQQVTS